MSDLEPDDLELRRAARERALELLYEAEIKGLDVDELLAGLALPPDELTVELVRGVDARRRVIDELLERRVAPRWSLARLAAVDRAVLRLGAYELLEAGHRPAAVILNEAVVLARRFGTDDSPRFVNGVLSAVAAEVRSGEPTDPGGGVDVPDPADPVALGGAGPAASGVDVAGVPREGRSRSTRTGGSGGSGPVLEALVMDLDGVIRHWDEAAVAAGDDELGLPPGTIAAAAFEPERLERCMRGHITAEEWFAEIGATVARQQGVAAEAVAGIMAGVGWRIDESVMGLVAQVRRAFPVALLSNASSRLLDDLRLSGIDSSFDAVVGSAGLGLVKPERGAFLAAADALGVPPELCLLVDDREENVEGAGAAGMHAVLFTGVAPLARALGDAGLLNGLVTTSDVEDPTA